MGFTVSQHQCLSLYNVLLYIQEKLVETCLFVVPLQNIAKVAKNNVKCKGFDIIVLKQNCHWGITFIMFVMILFPPSFLYCFAVEFLTGTLQGETRQRSI